MFLTLLATLAIAQADSVGLVNSKVFSMDVQWKAIEASPRLIMRHGDSGTGSSVTIAVKDGFAYALTAAHVVRENAKLEADFFVQSSYPAGDHSVTGVTVIAKNATADLALLKVPLPEMKPVPPALKLIPPGQRPKTFPFPVLTVGCDDGFSARCLEDQVFAKKFVRRNANQCAFFWETTNTSRFGRSGGPLLDSKLRVIGICAANQNNRGYFVHTDEIHAWLKTIGYDWLSAE